jgi:hypothetical protein
VGWSHEVLGGGYGFSSVAVAAGVAYVTSFEATYMLAFPVKGGSPSPES